MEQRRPDSAPAALRPSVPFPAHLPTSPGSRVVKQSGPSWAIKGGYRLPTHPFPGCLPAWGLALPQERSLPPRSRLGPPWQGSACTVPAEKALLTPALPRLMGFLPRKESLGSLGSWSAHCNQLRVTGFPCSRGAGSMGSSGQPRSSPELGPAVLSKDPRKPKALHPHHKTRGRLGPGPRRTEGARPESPDSCPARSGAKRPNGPRPRLGGWFLRPQPLPRQRLVQRPHIPAGVPTFQEAPADKG